VFGFVKGKFTGVSKIKSALQTVLVGGLALCTLGVRHLLHSGLADDGKPGLPTATCYH